MISNIAVSNRFSTSNPTITEVPPALNSDLEFSAYGASKLRYKPIACLNFTVAIELRHCLALLVHLQLPLFERIVSDFSLLGFWS